MARVKMTPSEAVVETLLVKSVGRVADVIGSACMDMLELSPAAGILGGYGFQESAQVGIRRMVGEGVCVDHPDEVRDALDETLHSGNPVVLDIMTAGTRLAPPCRSDGLSQPDRCLSKNAETDYQSWAKEKLES